ncbi:Spore maturation protein A [hydrothermal vent metagenome]|uniref:Spore maturation protein A n=1 Tax=hydrothermal vent metagenome TaxID=652676 RepID=A0A3B0WKC2_9ZZZZ
MLNKIWAGLIIFGILFALGQDIRDEISNKYNNGITQSISYAPINNSPNSITITFNSIKLKADIKKHYLYIHLNSKISDELQNIATANGSDTLLIARIISTDASKLNILLPELHWNKLRAVTQAAFDMAKFAIKLAIGLIGIMALWLGLMQIAEKSRLIDKLVKIVHPLLHWLFPNIPKDHPALGSISMNMSANILGLGNAATPLGIKAMQQLQELNTQKDQASDEMCMFLALNTSSVQLLPPVTLIALMGTQVAELIIPIILATTCSTITAITVAKFYARKRATTCNS